MADGPIMPDISCRLYTKHISGLSGMCVQDKVTKLVLKAAKLCEHNACDANYSGSTSFPNKGPTRGKNGAPAEAGMQYLPEKLPDWKTAARKMNFQK